MKLHWNTPHLKHIDKQHLWSVSDQTHMLVWGRVQEAPVCASHTVVTPLRRRNSCRCLRNELELLWGRCAAKLWGGCGQRFGVFETTDGFLSHRCVTLCWRTLLLRGDTNWSGVSLSYRRLRKLASSLYWQEHSISTVWKPRRGLTSLSCPIRLISKREAWRGSGR